MWIVIWTENGKFNEQEFNDVYDAHQLVIKLSDNSNTVNIKMFKEPFNR